MWLSSKDLITTFAPNQFTPHLIMKKQLIVALLLCMSFLGQAQVNLGNAAKQLGGGENQPLSAPAMPSAGPILQQLAGGLQPSAMLPSWGGAKAGWLASAGKLASVAQGGQLLGQLAGFIKPASFNPGFATQLPGLIKSANSLKSLSQFGGLTSTLVGGLKPASLTPAFMGQKAGFMSALSGLK